MLQHICNGSAMDNQQNSPVEASHSSKEATVPSSDKENLFPQELNKDSKTKDSLAGSETIAENVLDKDVSGTDSLGEEDDVGHQKKQPSPEISMASKLAFIEKSLRIAENVVLGPSTSPKATVSPTKGQQEEVNSSSSRNLILGASASALANELLLKVSRNLEKTCTSEPVEETVPKDQQDNIQTSSNESAEKSFEKTTTSETQKDAPTEPVSILDVLSHMADLAGTQSNIETAVNNTSTGNTDSSIETQKEKATSIPSSPVEHFPEDHVPVTSNISFDYSIDSLIRNENEAKASTSKDESQNSSLLSLAGDATSVSPPLVSKSMEVESVNTQPSHLESDSPLSGSSSSPKDQQLHTSHVTKPNQDPKLQLSTEANQRENSLSENNNPPNTATQSSHSVSDSDTASSTSRIPQETVSPRTARPHSNSIPMSTDTNNFPLMDQVTAHTTSFPPKESSAAASSQSMVLSNTLSNTSHSAFTGHTGHVYSSTNISQTHRVPANIESHRQSSNGSVQSQPSFQGPNDTAFQQHKNASPGVVSPAISPRIPPASRSPGSSLTPPLSTFMSPHPVTNTNTFSHNIGVSSQNSFAPPVPRIPPAAMPGSGLGQLPELNLQDLSDFDSMSALIPDQRQLPVSNIHVSEPRQSAVMAPPRLPQQNMPMSHIGNGRNTGQLEGNLTNLLSQQLAYPSSTSAPVGNHFSGQNNPPHHYQSHWQASPMYHWRGPNGLGMPGQDGYGQFSEFQLRPPRPSYVSTSQNTSQFPPNVTVSSNVHQPTHQINLGMPNQFSHPLQQSMSNDNMRMELTRYAMAELQKQNMQAARTMQASRNNQTPHAVSGPSKAVPSTSQVRPQRGISLASFANQANNAQVRPEVTRGTAPYSNLPLPRPERQQYVSRPRPPLHQQTIPGQGQPMHRPPGMINRPPVQPSNIPRYPNQQTAKRMAAPPPKAATPRTLVPAKSTSPNSQLSAQTVIQHTSKSTVSGKTTPERSTIAPTTSPTAGAKSSPGKSTEGDSNSQSLAALVVESVLRGRDTNHVEQQIRLVNELMRGKSPGSSSSQQTGSDTSGASSIQPVQKTSEVVRQQTPPSQSSSQSAGEHPSQTRRKPARSQPMFVDLTEEENLPASKPVPKQARPDRTRDDIHILIEVVNVRSEKAQFCLLERCLGLICKPKFLTKVTLTHNWHVFQTEKKVAGPRNEDVAYVAAQIIARSQHDKLYFREQMTTILNSERGKRAKIFHAISTDRVHVMGRSFMRPKDQCGLLYMNALKDFTQGKSTTEYLQATTTANMIEKVKELSEVEKPTSVNPQVVVIQPISDTTPSVVIEPPVPTAPPERPLSAQEKYALENQAPIVIEPPPTPAPNPRFQEEEAIPLVIAPTQGESSRPQPQFQQPASQPSDQTKLNTPALLERAPLVIAPPPTPRPPSPVEEPMPNRMLPAATTTNSRQWSNLNQQPISSMQPPGNFGQPGRTHQIGVTHGQQSPSQYQSCPPPSHSPLHTLQQQQQQQHQRRKSREFEIQAHLVQQQQQQVLKDQHLQQQLQIHNHNAMYQLQRIAAQRMVPLEPASKVVQPPTIPATPNQELRPNNPVLQGLVPKATPFLVGDPLPIVLAQNPGVIDKPPSLPIVQAQSQGAIEKPPVPQPSLPNQNIQPKPIVPAASQSDQNPSQTQNGNPANTQDFVKEKTVKPTPQNESSEKRKQDSAKDKTTGSKANASVAEGEYISLEDFITLSTDQSREVCASVTSSVDDEKREPETRMQEHLKALLSDGSRLPEDDRDPREHQQLRVKLHRIEDVCGLLGLKRLKGKHQRYKILEGSSLRKPKRSSVKRRFHLDDGIQVDNDDNDPVWEEDDDYESPSSPSFPSSSTDEYSEEEEDGGRKRRVVRRKKVRRTVYSSSDEDAIGHYNVYESDDDSPEKKQKTQKKQKRKRKRIESEGEDNSSPKKEVDSEKSKPKKRLVINSDDEPSDVSASIPPILMEDPIFPPSPPQNHPPRDHTPSKLRQGEKETSDTKTPKDIIKDIEALRQICPSLQPYLRIPKLTPEEIAKYTARKRKRPAEKTEKTTAKEPKKMKKPVNKTPKPVPQTNPQPNSTEAVAISNTDSSNAQGESNHVETVPPKNVQPTKPISEPGDLQLPEEYDLEFFSNDQLWQELQRRQNFVSCICGMTFIDVKHYNLHRDLHDKFNPKKCAICCEVFNDWVEFTSHTYSTHKSL